MTRPIVSPPLAAWDAEHIMAELERLSHLTAQIEETENAAAFVLAAIAKHALVGGVRDPDMLDGFFARAHASAPLAPVQARLRIGV